MKHKLLWDFEIQMDHLITFRKNKPSVNKKEKKNLLIWTFWWNIVKIRESEMRQILGSYQRAEEPVENKGGQ